MMNNLFSNFDPSTKFFFSINWMSIYMCIIMLPSIIWMIPSRPKMLINLITYNLHLEFIKLINNKFSKSITLIFISMMMFIMFNNFLGLYPYIFTSTSHLVLTLALSLPLWISFMIYGWLNKTNHMFTHLVPQGTPIILMPFMVCIETIGNLIRPGTLAIRLAANMIAGHLLLTLLGNNGPMINILMLNLLLVIQLLILILESAVAIIQSYVFAMLTVLYSSEVI